MVTIDKTADTVTFGNAYVSRTFSTKDQILRTLELENRITGQKYAVQCREFNFGSEGESISSEQFALTGYEEQLLDNGGKALVFSLEQKNGGAKAQVRVEMLPHWTYMKKTVSFWAAALWDSGWLSDVTVDDLHFGRKTIVAWGVNESIAGPISNSARTANGGWSFPVLADSFFLGLEFPLGQTKVHEAGARVVIEHRPYVRTGPQWIESRAAVFGVGQEGKGRAAFERYFDETCVKPNGMNFEYNNYWSVKPDQQKIYAIMDELEEQLHQPYGTKFDTFLIDAGWSSPQSVWRIDPEKFPDDIEGLVARSRKAGYRMGLWVSAGASLMDDQWAANEGYEVGPAAGGENNACMMVGAKWHDAFTDSLIHAVNKGIEFFKFDFYSMQCARDDHGHAPGVKGRETMIQGLFECMRRVREVNPNVWFKESRMSSDFTSPWWSLGFNVISGPWWSDSPVGFVPAPNYRHAKITGRDASWVQGMKASQVLVPARATQSLGVVHQRPNPAFDEIVTNVLRGGMLMPYYVNLDLFDKEHWKFLANMMVWARTHEQTLAHTKTFGGVPLDRQVYGFAHFTDAGGFVFLRNPFIYDNMFDLHLDGQIDFPESADAFLVRKIYPHRKGLVPKAVRGDRLQVPLGGYETLVLEFLPASKPDEPVAMGIRYGIQEQDGASQLYLMPDTSSPADVSVMWPDGRESSVKVEEARPVEPLVDDVVIDVAPEPKVTGKLLHVVEDERTGSTATETVVRSTSASLVKNTFVVDVPQGTLATLCFLLESQVVLRPKNCTLIVDDVVRYRGAGVADSAQDEIQSNETDIQREGLAGDMSDALAALSESSRDRLQQEDGLVRFVQPEQSDFQGYADQHYYLNHWMWILSDLEPGRCSVHFEALCPPLVALTGPNMFGSWVQLKSPLAKQALPLGRASSFSKPAARLYLPNEAIETKFVVVTPYHKV